MKKSSHRITASSVVGAALLCLMPQTRGLAQSYTIRPTASPNGQCRVSTETFGYNDTDWRQWPVQPRPEQRDPKTIGGDVLLTPPPIPEQALPHADNVPGKPPLSGGNTGGQILPFPGLTPGAIDGNVAPSPNNPPAGQNPQLPAPEGLHMPLDLNPGQPGATPKNEGSGIEPLFQPKGQTLPGGILKEPTAPIPGTPGGDGPKVPEKNSPVPKPLDLSPDVVPSPAPKPEETSPAKPIKGSSLSRRRNDAVAARATTIENGSPIRANWNASLGAEALADSQLRNTSFQQHTSLETGNSLRSRLETCNPLRSVLGGYCPVQLQDNNRWVAGSPDFRTSYRGQVFLFSSEAAMKRFEANPEKYAPVRNGNDIVLAAEENRTVPGSVNHSAVWRGRLYLFSNSATLATFQEDPARYVNKTRPTPLRTPADSL